MSTAGSPPEPGRPEAGGAPTRVARETFGTYEPGSPPRPFDDDVTEPKAPRRRRIVRWQGLIPLAVVSVLVAVGYVLFADRVARNVTRDAATDLLGTQVDLDRFEILEQQSAVALHGLAIADPFDPKRNLVEIADLEIAVEPLPLLEKKVIVRQFSMSKVRVGTQRRVPAKPVESGGLAPRAIEAARKFRSQIDVPLLRLAPLDSVKAIAVDPTKLSAVRAALALRGSADSVQSDVRSRFDALRIQATVDSAREVATRLSNANVRSLGITGVRTAVSDVRRTLASVDSAKRRVESLKTSAQSGFAQLDARVRGIDDSAHADFVALRSLMSLPTVAAPDIGGALFGQVTIDQLQKLLYWAALAEQYTPPGLRPRPEPGPKRLRAAGSTIHFVKAGELPRFWLRRGDLTLQLDEGPAKGNYRLRAQDLTSDPALVGRPMMAVLERVGSNEGLAVRAVALVDRVSRNPRDSIAVSLSQLPLPSFAVPSTPFHLDPGAGQSTLSLARSGERINGRFDLRANAIRWKADSARLRTANTIERLVYRVITGIRDVQIAASVTGTMSAPKLSARSNLDRAVAEQLESVVGEEVARAEARLRGEVNRVVEAQSATVKAKVADVRQQGEAKIDEARARLDEERAKLDAKLKELTKGVVGLPLK